MASASGVNVTPELETFLNRLKDDDVSTRIKSDGLLTKMASAMFAFRGDLGFNDSSQKLRAASILLGSLRSVTKNPAHTFLHFLKVEQWTFWKVAIVDYTNARLIRTGQVVDTIITYARGYLLEHCDYEDFEFHGNTLRNFQDLFRSVIAS